MRLICTLITLLFLSPLLQAEEWASRQKVGYSFEDARDAVVMAIESRGLVINYTSHLAEMLARTGADLGASKKIFAQAEIIEFCSARLSRQMMEADPHNIVLCPFAISIYTLPGEAGTWIAYRKPQGQATAPVSALLREITGEAAR